MSAVGGRDGAVPRILFICTGNICRSPTAQALLVHRAASAGLAVQVDSAAISDEERGNPFDARAAAELLLNLVPGREGQDVPDPWYGDARAFVQAFDLIELGVQGLMAQLRAASR